MVAIYSLIIRVYGFLIRIGALFNPKASLWIKGRRGLFENLEKSVSIVSEKKPGVPRLWFHCASLGEFEQGRPLIEKLGEQHPEFVIFITFQSPSGYEVRKHYAGADIITYLPLDTPRNARKFINLVHPSLVVFVKYEFWFNYLIQLQKRKTPVYLVSAVFRPDQHFFKWYGYWPRKIIKGFAHIFVQNEYSKEVLEFVDIKNVTVSGDTRFDRVGEVVKAVADYPRLAKFTKGHPAIVAGSTWPADEELLLECFERLPVETRLLLVPHEIHQAHLNALLEKCRGNAVLYSQADEIPSGYRIVIIDTIGMLNKIYRFGQIAYVGGGFGTGIHNILEPAAYGLPVIFGPNYRKFGEALELADLKGAFPISDVTGLYEIISRLLQNRDFYERSSENSARYVETHKGATELIAGYLEKQLEGLNYKQD